MMLLSIKKIVRKQILEKINLLTNEYIQVESSKCMNNLISSPIYQKSHCISCFLSMPNEVQTRSLIENIFQNQTENNDDSAANRNQPHRRLFIPKVYGKDSHEMLMLELKSMQEYMNLPRNKWNIPEHDIDKQLCQQVAMESERDGMGSISKNMGIKSISVQDGTSLGLIDLVILPGVGFDKYGSRIGYGRGYYDCFIKKLKQRSIELNCKMPFLVAVALDEQIMEHNNNENNGSNQGICVPMEDHDEKLDALITPSKVYIFNHALNELMQIKQDSDI